MSATITTKLVTKDGSIDVDASCQAFADSLTKFVEEHSVEQETIAAAVNAAFDRFPGARINLPALTGSALQTLNASPDNYASLQARVAQYVRDNAGEGGLYEMRKGKGGGVARTADLAAK